MKKLLFLLLLSCFQVNAQNRQILGLCLTHWLVQFSGALVDGPSYNPETGWGAGLDYNYGFSERWDVKVGLRYHHSVSVYENNNLMYGSEYSTGVYVYDPTLPHSVRFEYQNKAWQCLVGGRFYFSAPQNWRWYADGEFGLTQYEQRQTASPPALFLTSGVGLGLQWMPPEKQFGVFVQPTLHLATNPKQTSRSDAFLMSAIEVGVRTLLFSDK